MQPRLPEYTYPATSILESAPLVVRHDMTFGADAYVIDSIPVRLAVVGVPARSHAAALIASVAPMGAQDRRRRTELMKPSSMSFPDIDGTAVQCVVEVLRRGRLVFGPRALASERAVAGYVGTRYAIAVSSGTAALHLAIRALGLGPGDEVLVPSFTFAATVNTIPFEGLYLWTLNQ